MDIDKEIIDNNLILLCPNCCINIPYIELKLNENKTISIEIQCNCSPSIMVWELTKYLASINKIMNKKVAHKCSTNNCNNNITADHYCAICLNWVCKDCYEHHSIKEPKHIITTTELHLSCLIHHLEYEAFCVNCNRSICKECKNAHQTHQTIQINNETHSLDLFIKSTSIIPSINNQNQTLGKILEEFLNKNSFQFAYLTKYIKQAYKHNKKTNEALEQLCTLLINTGRLILSVQHYFFNKSISNITFNTKANVNIDENDIDNSFKRLDEHYAKDYIIKFDKEPRVIHQITTTIINEELVLCLIQLLDGRLVSGSKEGMMTFWDSNVFKCLKTIKIEKGNEVSALLQLFDNRLVSGHFFNYIKVWDCNTY